MRSVRWRVRSARRVRRLGFASQDADTLVQRQHRPCGVTEPPDRDLSLLGLASADHEQDRRLGEGVFANLSPTKREGMEVRGPLREKLRCRTVQVAQRNAPRRYSGRASSHRTVRSRSPPCRHFSKNVAAFLAPTFSARAHAMKWSSETSSRLAQSSAAALSDLGRFDVTRALPTAVSPSLALATRRGFRCPRTWAKLSDGVNSGDGLTLRTPAASPQATRDAD